MVARSAGKVDPQLCSVADHEALKLNTTVWEALKLKGHQYTPADEFGPDEVLELRDCACCSSTLAVQLRGEALAAFKKEKGL